jgi:hypothetical protein
MKLGQVIKIEQRGIAEYDRLATGCRSRPAASKINKTASMRSPRWAVLLTGGERILLSALGMVGCARRPER